MRIMISSVVCASIGAHAHAELVYYDNQQEAQWYADAGPLNKMSFADLGPVPVLLTNQYASIGALFTDGDDVAFKFGGNDDGWGYHDNPGSNIGSTISFSSTQFWLGIDYPGSLQIQVFMDDVLVAPPKLFPTDGAGNFFGIVTSTGFNKIHLTDPFDGIMAVDNIYFGAPVPAPAATALLLAAGLVRQRRRREP